jgi:hypothetical protein
VSAAYGWHFVANDRKLAHSGEPLELNRTYRVDGTIIPCQNGLHGSLRLINALQYAQGSILTRCRYSGTIVHQADKLAASERTPLWIGDIEPILHEAACHFAETALRAAKVTDPRSWAAIEAKRAWLRGEITDKALAAARAAAWDAAGVAAWDAAGDAAWAAAWDAARAAAGVAARAAAGAAANDWLECAVRHFAGVDSAALAPADAAPMR